ncbi:MAG: glycosyl transferase family 1 [Bacteroidetes bacterium]|nr:MAG: glycosyl transferase family 1 [Bacteroidota bacterium]
MKDVNNISRKVLIITYYWPPSGGAGVQRWLKFSKYLREFGWEPIIYTPENPDVPIFDESLVKDIPNDLVVLKLPIFEPSRVVSLLGGGSSTGRTGASKSPNEKSSFIEGFSRWVRGNIFVPDARVTWVRPSYKFLKNYLEENRVDVIISTGPPHSMHLIGLKVKQAFPKIKWVSDFRDPWSDMDYLDEFKMGKRAMRKLVAMEKEVIKFSDHVIINSPSVAKTLLGSNNDPKASLIPNGWDMNDFVSSNDINPNEKTGTRGVFKLGHFGSLYGSRNAPGLWRAVKKWNLNENDKVEVVLVGTVGDEIKDSINNIDSIKLLGGMGHKEAVREMMNCDGLLLVQNDTDPARKCTPGKLYEYIACKKPIFSVCNNPSDLATRLDEWNLPYCDHDDEKAAYEMLRQITSKEGQKIIDASPFERRALTETLSHLLNKLIS